LAHDHDDGGPAWYPSRTGLEADSRQDGPTRPGSGRGQPGGRADQSAAYWLRPTASGATASNHRRGRRVDMMTSCRDDPNSA
jgi:hypothetical protein